MGAAALLGMTGVMLSTRWGPGISYDSAQYLFGALSLSSGQGLLAFGPDGVIRPLTWWGPLLPVVLAAGALFQLDPERTMRLLNAFCLGGTVLLAGAGARTMASSDRAAALVTFLLVTTVPFMAVFAFAWSESLFILVTVAGAVLLARACTTGHPGAWLAAATVISLAPLIRYIGALLPAIGALVIHLAARDARERPVERFRRSALFLVVTFAPVALWLALSHLRGQRPTGRTLGTHPLTATNLALLVDTLATWVVPARVVGLVPWPFRLLVCLALSLLWLSIAIDLLRSTRDRHGEPPTAETLRLTFEIFVLTYIPVLLLAAALLDPFIAFDFRLLSPLFVPLVLVAVGRHWPQGRPRSSALVGTAVTLLAIFGLSNVARTASWLKRAYRDGNGYESRAYRVSRMLDVARALPPQRVLISDDPIMLYTHTGLVSARVPGETAFEDRIRAAGDATLIYFCGRTNLPPPHQLAPALSFEQVFASECPSYPAEPSIFAWPPDPALAEGTLYRLARTRHARTNAP